ncbi:hypothetical protein [Actinoplanes sp. NPDC051851]|uniref:hypothetical protein n=1 Tax=Actinoplanes sp. NPDC051851 TaxID=3154753 RepID=UPI00342DC130
MITTLVLMLSTADPAAASPPRSGDFGSSAVSYTAQEWTEAAIEILMINRKAVAWCLGNLGFLSYGVLRAMRAITLKDRILDIAGLATGLTPEPCVATFRAAQAAYRVWAIGARDGGDLTVQDDSYVVVHPGPFANECHLDITVSDADGQTWNYAKVYEICSKNTYYGRYTYA